jgi:hypothetical protein
VVSVDALFTLLKSSRDIDNIEESFILQQLV